jgi:hypothetical protein
MITVTDKEIIIDLPKLAKKLAEVSQESDPVSAIWEGESEEETPKEEAKREPETAEERLQRSIDEETKAHHEKIGVTPVDDGVDLFEEGPNGVGGTLQDAPQGKEKIKAMRDWLTENKFNYRNFCLFLLDMRELAGWKLKKPLIGVTTKKDPTLFKVAARFHSYWLSSQDEIARLYKTFLIGQLEDMGITIRMVEDVLDGEEIDPKNLPKGIEVNL